MLILNIGERIGVLRTKVGMTQTDLAKALGISRNAVNLWEMSLSSPSLSNIVELSRVFNVSVDYLLNTDERELVDVSELTFEEKEIIYKTIALFKNKKTEE